MRAQASISKISLHLLECAFLERARTARKSALGFVRRVGMMSVEGSLSWDVGRADAAKRVLPLGLSSSFFRGGGEAQLITKDIAAKAHVSIIIILREIVLRELM
jgi:hypothetical protein